MAENRIKKTKKVEENKTLVETEGERKKNFVIYRDPAYAHFRIKYEGGGELPGELKGRFTHYDLAELAIENYLRKRDG